MPRIERSATVTWEGNLARGTGKISGDTGAFTELPFSLPTRIGKAEGRTSPEELLASAHGGCLTMGLAGELTQNGTPPTRLDTSCLVVMDELEGAGHQIVASHIRVRVDADGVDAQTLATLLEQADASCPFSTLLRNAGVEVDIQLA